MEHRNDCKPFGKRTQYLHGWERLPGKRLGGAWGPRSLWFACISVTEAQHGKRSNSYHILLSRRDSLLVWWLLQGKSESEVNRKEKQPFLVNTNTGASASVNPAERDSCSIFQIDFKGGFRALNLTLWRKKKSIKKEHMWDKYWAAENHE